MRVMTLQSWDENEAPERLLKAPGSPGTNFKGRSPQSPDCPSEAAAHQRSMAGVMEREELTQLVR